MIRKRILIVDDDATARGLVQMGLERSGGYEIQAESDGRRALELMRRSRPDLVLLDVEMPGMNGAEIANQMQRDRLLQNIPVLFLTSLVGPGESDQGNAGFGGHRALAKPVPVGKLILSIESELVQSRPAGSAGEKQ